MDLSDALFQTFSLDRLVTRHRDTFVIGLATPEEVAGLATTIASDRAPKATLDEWFLVAFRFPEVPDKVLLYLLGFTRDTGLNQITSPLTGIDLERGFVTTHSGSLYALGQRSEDAQPPILLVVHVAAALWLQAPEIAAYYGIPYAWY